MRRTTLRPRSQRLLGLDACRFDDGPCSLGIGFYERAKSFWGLSFARKNLKPEFDEPGADFLIGEGVNNRSIEPANDVGWRSLGREKSEPRRQREPRESNPAPCPRAPRLTSAER
jgi:hypothetical protein